MSWFPRPVSPLAALADLRAFMRHRSREQVIGAALAFLVTIIIVIEFFVDSKINTAPPAQIIYVEQWPENRTDAQIASDQAKDEAERQAAIAARRKQFKDLENKLGM